MDSQIRHLSESNEQNITWHTQDTFNETVYTRAVIEKLFCFMAK